MKLLRWLLFPVSVLYGWLMRFRNHLYNIGNKPAVEFDRVIISVGNLSMGGTGKTPMVEYLIRLLKDDFRLATLSRGYGRKTRGYKMVDDSDSAETVGDEPFQYFKKFGKKISVCVGEERILAIPSAIMEKEEIELFLLDDAFQHRKVARDFNILLSDYNHPFYDDFILPTGNLREGRKGADRADCVLITKCPQGMSEQERDLIKKKISVYAPSKPVYFSYVEYDEPQQVFQHTAVLEEGSKVVMLTGIAENSVFKATLLEKYKLINEFVFEDHHRFNQKDLDAIFQWAKSQKEQFSLVTTEKDMVRLLPFHDHLLFKNYNAFHIPIRFALQEEDIFKNQLLKVVDDKRNLR